MIYADELFARRLHSDVMENFDPRMWEQCNATLRVNRKALLMGGASHVVHPPMGVNQLLASLISRHCIGGWVGGVNPDPIFCFGFSVQKHTLFKEMC